MARGKYEKWLTENGLTLLKGWATDGLINEQIAHNMGINPKTLYEWMKRYPAIDEAISAGKEVIDRQVENALLKRALGYEYTESKKKYGADGLETTTTVKEIAPDVTAAIFWLKNRKPDAWKDQKDINAKINPPDKLNDILIALTEDDSG